MRRLSFTVGCMLLFSLTLIGQEKEAYFHHLTVEDGLSQGTNHFIYKDSRGFVWLSSINGLNRYDGREVKEYQPSPTSGDSTSLFGQNIQSQFYETRQGNLWFCTFEAVIFYDRKTDSFQHYQLDPQEKTSPGYHVFFMDKTEDLWVLVNGMEIYKFNTRTRTFSFFHSIQHSSHRINVKTDKSGNVVETWAYAFQSPGVWVTPYEAGVPGVQYSLFSSKKKALPLRNILFESDTLIWLCTELGLHSYNPSTKKLHHYGRLGNKNSEQCTYAVQYSPNVLLVAIKGQGLLLFDKKQRHYVKHFRSNPTNPHGMSSKNYATIFRDKDGVFWLSTENYGVDFFYPQKNKFSALHFSDSLLLSEEPFDVKCITVDAEGNTWYGTANQGIVVLDKENKLLYNFRQSEQPAPESLPEDEITQLFKDSKDRIWVVTWAGAVLWLPDKRQFIRPDLQEKQPIRVFQLRDGRYLISGVGGGFWQAIETGPNQFRLDSLEKVPYNSINAFTTFYEDNKGRLLACENLNSIRVMDPSNGFKKLTEIPLPGESHSYCEIPGDPYVYVANSYGLARLDIEADSFKMFTPSGQPISMKSIHSDKNGKFWLSSGKGLARFDPTSETFSFFTLADGLSTIEFNNSSSFARNNRELLFGSTNGVTHFFPETVHPITVKAHPVLTGLRINDQPATNLVCELTGATNINEIKRLELSPSQNTLTFHFAALEYSDPANTSFRYQLEGIDTGWVDGGKANFVRYARLPGNNYVFRLKASNSDGIWSEEETIQIYISSPFNETWWFFALIIFSVAAFLAAFWYLWRKQRERQRLQREAQRQALENERQRIARDMHDDLGSSLSALSLLSEIARYKQTPEELRADIEKINQTSIVLSDKIREVIWTVSASNDTLANLISYIHRYAIELFEATEIDCFVNLPETFPDLAVGGEQRRTLFLACKEAFNNISKYAEATQVTIDFDIIDNKLEIRILDDGKGFDPALLERSSGNGLRNMRSRMQDIQGHCKISTGPQGTQVHFSMALSKATKK